MHTTICMHAPLQEIADLLARTRGDVLAVWQALPPDTRERRPSPGRWTPAEVLDHLRLVETGSAALLAKRLQRMQEAGLADETDHRSRLDTFDMAGVVNIAPFDAPESVRPTRDVRAVDAEAGLRASRVALDRVMTAANGRALGDVKAHHLRFGEIDFYQWLLFVAAHEQRHLRQLIELRDALATPSPA